jgi:hypothetical protein
VLQNEIFIKLNILTNFNLKIKRYQLISYYPINMNRSDSKHLLSTYIIILKTFHFIKIFLYIFKKIVQFIGHSFQLLNIFFSKAIVH